METGARVWAESVIRELRLGRFEVTKAFGGRNALRFLEAFLELAPDTGIGGYTGALANRKFLGAMTLLPRSAPRQASRTGHRGAARCAVSRFAGPCGSLRVKEAASCVGTVPACAGATAAKAIRPPRRARPRLFRGEADRVRYSR